MKTILLYYKYTDVQFPAQQVKRQKELCDGLGLKGRIIIATEGINGTLAGSQEACNEYIEHMNAHELFNGIDFKISQCEGEPFPACVLLKKKRLLAWAKAPKRYLTKTPGHI